MVQPLNFSVPVQDPLESVRRGLEFGQKQALRPELLANQRAALERQGVEQEHADVRFGQANTLFEQEQALRPELLARDRAAQDRTGAVQGQQDVLFEQGQADRVAAADDAQRQQQSARKLQRDLEDLAENPNAGAYARIITENPQIATEMNQAWSILDKAEQDSQFLLFSQLYSSTESAIKSGDTARPIKLLEDKIEALNNTPGREDEAEMTTAALELLKTDPKAGLASLGVMLQSVDPVKAKAVLGEILTPEDQALADAKLQLTQAQIAQVKATTKKDLAALDNAGRPGLITDPKEVAEQEDRLRKELEDRSKVFNATRDSFRRIAATTDTAVGDISLIFQFMKMLDPGSVVRETEFATAQNAAGVPDRVRNMFNRTLEGTRLSPDQRTSFKKEAEGLMAAAKLRREENLAGVRSIIARRGFTLENVIFDEVTAGDDGATSDQPSATPDQEFSALFGAAQ